MSATETVNLTVSATEVRSISDVASIIANTIQKFAEKYGVEDQYDQVKLEKDLSYFLVKRNAVGLEEIEISILDDGSATMGGTVTGRRLADLIFRIRYADGRRSF